MSGLVMKFGGSSVADAACIREAAALVGKALHGGPLVVLSAAGKTTDALFAAARAAQQGDSEAALAGHESLLARHRAIVEGLFEGATPSALHESLAAAFGELETLLRGIALVRELSPGAMDAVAAIGERLSTLIFAAHFRRLGADATWFDAREALRTDDRHGAAQPDMPEIARLVGAKIAPKLGPGRVVVTQGYVGATKDGMTTTLGRGGSDYSAALFGAAARVDEIQIWTDVEGVMTADPRVVPGALPIAELSFAEAAELAAFGAKVLHPATIQPAVEAGIPVTVRHTRMPDGRFTTIRGDVRTGRAVTALAARGPVTVLTVTSTRMLNQSGYLSRVFEVFSRRGVSVDVVATAEVSVSMTVEADAPVALVKRDLEAFATVEVGEGRAIVAVVGERLRSTAGIGARALAALSDVNIEVISMGANEINLSLVLAQAAAPDALRRLHRALIEGRAS